MGHARREARPNMRPNRLHARRQLAVCESGQRAARLNRRRRARPVHPATITCATHDGRRRRAPVPHLTAPSSRFAWPVTVRGRPATDGTSARSNGHPVCPNSHCKHTHSYAHTHPTHTVAAVRRPCRAAQDLVRAVLYKADLIMADMRGAKVPRRSQHPVLFLAARTLF